MKLQKAGKKARSLDSSTESDLNPVGGRWLLPGACLLFLMISSEAFAKGASWYDSKSVCREGTCCNEVCPTASGIDINVLEERKEDFCAASNDYKMGALLKVTNKVNGKSVVCRVRDRGGFSKKYKRSVDLSKQSFSKIADLKLGVIDVTIDVVG